MVVMVVLLWWCFFGGATLWHVHVHVHDSSALYNTQNNTPHTAQQHTEANNTHEQLPQH